ncbi:36635_t:CDS:2, partial [Gigaspora margarita]
ESSNTSVKKRSNISVKTFSMFELSKQFDMNHLQKNGIHDIFIDGKLIIGRFNSIDLIIKCLIADGSFLVLPSDVMKFIKTVNEKRKEAYGFLVTYYAFTERSFETIERHDKLIKDIVKTINERNIRKLKIEKNKSIDEYIAAIKIENKGLKEAIEIKDRKIMEHEITIELLRYKKVLP